MIVMFAVVSPSVVEVFVVDSVVVVVLVVVEMRSALPLKLQAPSKRPS